MNVRAFDHTFIICCSTDPLFRGSFMHACHCSLVRAVLLMSHLFLMSRPTSIRTRCARSRLRSPRSAS